MSKAITALPTRIDPKHSPLGKSLLSQMFKTVEIEIELTTAIVVGIPQKPEMIQAWVASKMKEQLNEAEMAKLATRTLEELPRLADEKAAEHSYNTFKTAPLPDGREAVYIESRQVKAMIKENSNILRDVLIKNEAKGEAKKSRFTALKSKVAETVFVVEEPLFMWRPENGERVYVTKPEASEEKPIHVMTAQGPRTALKRVDLVKPGVHITFKLKYLNGATADEALLQTFFELAQMNGLGSDRSQGRGQFTVLRFDSVD